MKLLLLSFLILASTAAVPAAAAAAAGPIGTTFLYHAWGIEISGLPVFYDNGAFPMSLGRPSSPC